MSVSLFAVLPMAVTTITPRALAWRSPLGCFIKIFVGRGDADDLSPVADGAIDERVVFFDAITVVDRATGSGIFALILEPGSVGQEGGVGGNAVRFGD